MKGKKITAVAKSIFVALWAGSSPFGVITALWPTDDSGKYVIQSEGIRLAFTNHGGALANLWINDTNGNEVDIVLGFDDATQYLSSSRNPYLGGAIGRYAGIISGASFELDDIRYNTSANGNVDGKPRTINGGEHGWGRMSFDVASHMKDSITFVVFDRGKNGFPGTAVSSLTHTLTPHAWHIAFGVTPTMAKSPISLSQQVFWNLDGFAEGSTKTVAEHTLHLPFSGLRLAADQDGIPTGDIIGNKVNSTYDFWSASRSLATGLRAVETSSKNGGAKCTGYDDTFLISRSQPWSKDNSPVATLSSPQSGIKLDLYTDQEALHVLTWNEADGSIPLKQTQIQATDTTNTSSSSSTSTTIIGAPHHAAISLQMQDWTDAVNHPEWQRDSKIFWGTHQLYTTYSTYAFSVT